MCFDAGAESLRTVRSRRLVREELQRGVASFSPLWYLVNLTVSAVLISTSADSHHKAFLLVYGEKQSTFGITVL